MALALVLTTVARKVQARRLASLALEHRAAACIQILPGVESHYRWQKKRAISREFLLLAKTTSARVKKLQKLWSKHHPYQCPEMVTLTGRSTSLYLRWVQSCL